MNKYFNPLLLGLVLCMFFYVNIHARSNDTPTAVGYWTTISDEDNKARSVVQIIQKHGKLEGRILKIYAKKNDHDYCINCTGKLKNKPIIGMRILWDLVPDGELSWSNGKILDPKNGKTYKCKATLEKDGKTLSVRGYIGISLFGRTQTWIRRKSA